MTVTCWVLGRGRSAQQWCGGPIKLRLVVLVLWFSVCTLCVVILVDFCFVLLVFKVGVTSAAASPHSLPCLPSCTPELPHAVKHKSCCTNIYQILIYFNVKFAKIHSCVPFLFYPIVYFWVGSTSTVPQRNRPEWPMGALLSYFPRCLDFSLQNKIIWTSSYKWFLELRRIFCI